MRSNAKPPSQRQLRVGEQIRHIVAECFQRGNVPKELLGFPPVSVMEARVSPDFSYCKVFVSVLSIDPGASVSLAKELNKFSGFFRTALAKNMRLRVAPEVRFFEDSAQTEADRIDTILASPAVQRDVLKAPQEEE